MGISDRIEGTIEKWAGQWSGRLSNWFQEWTSGALIKFMEILEPELAGDLDEVLGQLENNQAVPEVFRSIIGRARRPSKFIHIIIIVIVAILIFIPMILGLFQPLQRILNYAEERVFHSGRMDWVTAVTAWRRGFITEERLNQTLEDHGFDDIDTKAVKDVSLFYPSPSDLVLWQAREVFEEGMVEAYGLDEEIEGINREPFYKAGMTDEQIKNYWRAHWEHASFIQIVEMLRRGLITEDDVRRWFRLVEIPPFWRDKLIAISWEIPTRVDVRRFWDMRTIDEAELRRIYTAQGYHGVDLDNYVLWTKVYTAFPDLMAQYTNGWISVEELRGELVNIGMSAERAEELIRTKVKANSGDRVANERDLTKTDIYKGIKQNRITRDQGLELLMELGFDENEADILLDTNIPEDDQDDVTEYRKLTKTEIRDALDAEEIDDAGAIERLQALRYSLADAQLILKLWIFRRRELAKSDIIAAFNRETMDRTTALSRLLGLGYNEIDAAILLDRNEEPPEEIRLKEASKADIVKGVRDGVITPEEGYTMLTDIGYTPEAATFILEINPVSSPFSPISYNEFRGRTDKIRRAYGLEVYEMPEPLKVLGDQVAKQSDQVNLLFRNLKEYERGIADEASLNDAARAELTEKRRLYYQANDELSRLQTEFRAARAEWEAKHRG